MIDVILERLTKAPRNVLLGKMEWPDVIQTAVSLPAAINGGTCATLEDALVYSPSGGPVQIDACVKSGNSAIKVPGWTAIPEGRYRMRFTWSNRFKRWLPELFDVRGFTAVRLHAGNTVHDTAGCILLGITTGGLAGPAASVVESRDMVDQFCRWLGVAEQVDEVWLTVSNPT